MSSGSVGVSRSSYGQQTCIADLLVSHLHLPIGRFVCHGVPNCSRQHLTAEEVRAKKDTLTRFLSSVWGEGAGKQEALDKLAEF